VAVKVPTRRRICSRLAASATGSTRKVTGEAPGFEIAAAKAFRVERELREGLEIARPARRANPSAILGHRPESRKRQPIQTMRRSTHSWPTVALSKCAGPPASSRMLTMRAAATSPIAPNVTGSPVMETWRRPLVQRFLPVAGSGWQQLRGDQAVAI